MGSEMDMVVVIALSSVACAGSYNKVGVKPILKPLWETAANTRRKVRGLIVNESSQRNTMRVVRVWSRVRMR